MSGSFVIEPLTSEHNRAEFTCGVEALDRYFRQQAGQDMRRGVTACFVAREIATGRIAGYYTLCAGGILLSEMPGDLAKRLPRYPSVPVARLGRLAVADAYHGHKLGGALLWDAVDRAMRSEVAVYANGRRCQGRGGGKLLSASWLCGLRKHSAVSHYALVRQERKATRSLVMPGVLQLRTAC